MLLQSRPSFRSSNLSCCCLQTDSALEVLKYINRVQLKCENDFYAAAILELGRQKHYTEALNTFGVLLNTGVLPDGASLGAVLHVCVERGTPEDGSPHRPTSASLGCVARFGGRGFLWLQKEE